MKEQQKSLKLYVLSSPLMDTELLSPLGDKFQAFPVKFEFVDEVDHADVLVWDGILSPKSEVGKILEEKAPSKILLLLGESQTLFRDHHLVKEADLTRYNVVEVPGWSALPEDILAALETCYQKLNHV